jgi:hypothetical protein
VTPRACGRWLLVWLLVWLLIWLLDPATGPSSSGSRRRERTTGPSHALRSASLTEKRMGAPRIGVWEIEDGKIKTFDCYPESSIIFA